MNMNENSFIQRFETIISELVHNDSDNNELLVLKFNLTAVSLAKMNDIWAKTMQRLCDLKIANKIDIDIKSNSELSDVDHIKESKPKRKKSMKKVEPTIEQNVDQNVEQNVDQNIDQNIEQVIQSVIDDDDDADVKVKRRTRTRTIKAKNTVNVKDDDVKDDEVKVKRVSRKPRSKSVNINDNAESKDDEKVKEVKKRTKSVKPKK